VDTFRKLLFRSTGGFFLQASQSSMFARCRKMSHMNNILPRPNGADECKSTFVAFEEEAMDKIEEKWKKLRATGLDLGNPLAIQDPVQTESARRHGGSMRQYERGNIYWHPVMGTEAREVHGGILDKYLSVGGPGEDKISHRRILGFPMTDERMTSDGLCPVSYFEWGAIYWFWRAVVLHGDLHHLWKEKSEEGRQPRLPLGLPNDRMRAVPFGYPIDDQQGLADGQVVFCERGCLWKGPASNDHLLSFSLSTPPIGRPAIWNSEASSNTPLPIQIRCDASFDTLTTIARNNRATLFTEIWQGRLFLQRVVAQGQPIEEVPVECTQAAREEPGAESFGPVSPLWFRVPPGRKLSDRALYNIIYRNPDTGRTYPLGPHAIYAKSGWENFGFMHATDLHVSRRLETVRGQLRNLGLGDSEKRYLNYNDSFRDFVRFANHLHDLGTVDLILATGDLVDYEYEKGDNLNGGGNFTFFRKLILGEVPYPDPDDTGTIPPHEELRVPLFTVPGNHDYRKNPYDFFFEVELSVSEGVGGFLSWLGDKLTPDFLSDITPDIVTSLVSIPGRTLESVDPTRFSVAPFRHYQTHNLTEEDALWLTGRRGNTIPLQRSKEESKKMLEIDKLSAYFEQINDLGSYIIRLGPHRIVMLDSRWDIWLPKDVGDKIDDYLALNEEDQRTMMNGAENQSGIDGQHISLLTQALKQDDQGLVIVGIHAPPINPKGNEYPHYFRETELAISKWEEMAGFLIRSDPFSFMRQDSQGRFSSFDLSLGLHKHRNQGWIIDNPTTGFFKYGDVDDLLDWGISKGENDEFLRLCAGLNAPRKVDLLLCGHVHHNVEFRLAARSSGDLEFYTDFYSENPSFYYPSKMLVNSRIKAVDRAFPLMTTKKIEEIRSLSPTEAADAVAQPSSFAVPTYPNPLNGIADPQKRKEWWNDHRPLIVQTAAVGPLENSQRSTKPEPTFNGFRVGLVLQNMVSRIHYVRMKELRDNRLKMPWEPPNIKASYREVFGRDARADELAGWLNDPQTEGKSYEQVVSQHMEFLVSARGSEELREMIKRSYWAVFGREPVEDEILTWVNAVKTDGKTYDVIVRQHVDYMLSAAGSQELEYMIRRSYLVVLGREPSSDELAYWRDEIRQQRYQYWQLVEAHNRYKAGGGS